MRFKGQVKWHPVTSSVALATGPVIRWHALCRVSSSSTIGGSLARGRLKVHLLTSQKHQLLHDSPPVLIASKTPVWVIHKAPQQSTSWPALYNSDCCTFTTYRQKICKSATNTNATQKPTRLTLHKLFVGLCTAYTGFSRSACCMMHATPLCDPSLSPSVCGLL